MLHNTIHISYYSDNLLSIMPKNGTVGSRSKKRENDLNMKEAYAKKKV